MSAEPAGDPIFIVGPPRSGTHLMRFCLNRHSRIHVVFETAFFRKVYGNRRLVPESEIPRHIEWIVERLYRSGDPTHRDYEAAREAIVARVRGEDVQSYRQLARVCFSEMSALAEKPRWGEKTPFHVLFLDQVFDLFPEARVVAMERGVRNVVASYLRSTHLPDDLFLALAQYRLCRTALDAFRHQVHVVSYEELTARPENVLRGVAEYIGERFEPAMLHPGMRDSAYDEPVMEFDEAIGIESDDPDKWRRVLDEEQGRLALWADGRTKLHGTRERWMAARVRLKELRLRMSLVKDRWGAEDLRRFVPGYASARGSRP